MRAFITGINGFVGKHLVELLLSSEHEVIGIDRTIVKSETNVRQYAVNINDETKLCDLIGSYKPQQIYHLAAPSFIPDSYESPMETFRCIIDGTLNLMEAVRKKSPKSKLLLIGSSDEYGQYKGEVFQEDMLPAPCTPYASAKTASSVIGAQYAQFYGLDIVRTRSFNHIGPGQSPRFVCARIAKQLAELEKFGGAQITLGNINVSRDFLDVRDVVRAYYALMNVSGNSGELYNVCSGQIVSVEDILNIFLDMTDLRCRPGFEIINENQIRLYDNKTVCGSNAKLKEHTGWSKEISFDRTVADTLHYWRAQV